MAWFSKRLQSRGRVPTEGAPTVNMEGARAYEQDPKMELISILITSMLKDQYYRGADETAQRLAGLIEHIDPLFVAKATIFARNEHGLRTITHLAAAELAHRVKGEEWMKDFINAVVFRVDDMTEILAAYMSKYGKPIPNSLKKGLALAFNKFDGYKLSKYRGEGHALSLVDVVNLVHPTPNAKNEAALRDLVAGTLRSTETWEAKVSAAGQKAPEEREAAKAEAWNDLVINRKIGYLALLRNLRNLQKLNIGDGITDTQYDELIRVACETLTDENLVGESKIFPFQYLTAYHYVSSSRIRDALNKAVEISIANVPSLSGRSLIAVDHSGSMGEGIGSKKFMGDMFGAMLTKRTDADLMVFGTYAGYAELERSAGVIPMAMEMGYVNYEHGTRFGMIFRNATKAYDRVFIFSDMQSWIGNEHFPSWGRTQPEEELYSYKARHNADPFVYSFDLSGYGTSQFSMEGKHAQIPGLSEKVFDLLGVVETDKDALIHKIEAITF